MKFILEFVLFWLPISAFLLGGIILFIRNILGMDNYDIQEEE